MVEHFSLAAAVPSWIRFEHLARYEFAAGYVRSKVVVDAACGAGIGSGCFSRAGAERVEAFDLSAETIAQVRSRPDLPRTRFQEGDCTRLPLPDRFADVYVSLETIEHLERGELLPREAARILKPDGTFICSTPDRRVTNPGAGPDDRPRNRFHVREYTQEEFLRCLEPEFGRIEMFGQNPVGPRQMSFLSAAGARLPRFLAVRTGHVLKIPWLFGDRLELHRVQRASPGLAYGYWVAVCREPRQYSHPG